jgi:hypothetical protein
MEKGNDFRQQIKLLRLNKLVQDIHLLKGQEFDGLSVRNITKLRDILSNLQHSLDILCKYSEQVSVKQDVLKKQALLIIKFYVEFLAFWNIVPNTCEIVKVRKALNKSLNPLGQLYVQVLTLKFLNDYADNEDGEDNG